MTKRTLATGILALALLATPSLARAGVHFSFGIGLPFFGAVVAPAPAVMVPAPGSAGMTSFAKVRSIAMW